MNRYLELAITTAKKSKCRHKHGCVVVRNGKILSVTTNKKIGDPKVSWRTAHVHAEFAAIAAAGTLASGSNVYVARVSADGSPAPSEPCKKCKSILGRAGVSKVVWT
jgi:pyrimidine deaminase RibD-like protein